MTEDPVGNGAVTPPRKPNRSALSLTEYAANPTPPNEQGERPFPPTFDIPPDFILPNGYPDVRFLLRLIIVVPLASD